MCDEWGCASGGKQLHLVLCWRLVGLRLPHAHTAAVHAAEGVQLGCKHHLWHAGRRCTALSCLPAPHWKGFLACYLHCNTCDNADTTTRAVQGQDGNS